MLVAVDPADRPVAYADCEADGHIDHIFCLPSHSRQGEPCDGPILVLNGEAELFAAFAPTRLHRTRRW